MGLLDECDSDNSRLNMYLLWKELENEFPEVAEDGVGWTIIGYGATRLFVKEYDKLSLVRDKFPGCVIHYATGRVEKT